MTSKESGFEELFPDIGHKKYISELEGHKICSFLRDVPALCYTPKHDIFALPLYHLGLTKP